MDVEDVAPCERSLPGETLDVSGVVILYHPSESVLSNILTYLEELDELFVVDNSETPSEAVIEALKLVPNIHYVSFGENRGISHALNVALKRCRSTWLLTMDQDSHFESRDFARYKAYIVGHKLQNIAAYTIPFTTRRGIEPARREGRAVDRAITSGMVIHAEIARRLGGFDEALFIDGVDHEFCYRLKEHGYIVWLAEGIILRNQIGEPVKYNLLGRRGVATMHSALREYYMARNNLYILKRYRKNLPVFIANAVKSPIKAMLLGENKRLYLKAWLTGIWDGITEHMGKCSRNFGR